MKELYEQLRKLIFNNDDSTNPRTWADDEQINAFINQAIIDIDTEEQLAHYVAPTNFAYAHISSMQNIAKYLSSLTEEEELNKPLIVIANTETVLLKEGEKNYNKQGGTHWIAWVLLPKNYFLLSGEEYERDHYQVYFFDSLAKEHFPEQLKDFLTEGFAFKEDQTLIKRPQFCLPNEIIFTDCNHLTGQQNGMNGSDCGWWAVYYALMTVYTGGIEFLEVIKNRKLSAVPLREIMPLTLVGINSLQTTTNKKNSSSITFFPQLSSLTISAPVRIDDVVDAIPIRELVSYEMDHLLVSGYQGTDYQLLVLMKCLMQLMHEKAKFEAVVEIDGHGNLDDIGLIIKDEKSNKVQKVQAYQVKHYNHVISVADFFNSESEQSANAKMHIGKFFVGWLAWRKEKPQQLQSIVYSNNDVDQTLRGCLDQFGKFKEEFVQKREPVFIHLASEAKQKIPKNFLTKLEDVEITSHFSTKVWNELVRQGLLTSEGFFVGQPNIANLSFPKGILPTGLTAVRIGKHLQDLYNTYIQDRKNLYDYLFEQALEYLAKQSDHNELKTKTPKEKEKLFQEFLQSFQFQLNQKDFRELEQEVCEDLKKLINSPAEQIFVCLYYAIHEWFRSKHGTKFAITKEILSKFIQQVITKNKETERLYVLSEVMLKNISFCSGNSVSVERSEYSELVQAFKGKARVIRLIGIKGIGKSGLVKRFLQKHHHPSTYLAFSASDFLEDQNLLNRLLQVLKASSYIKTVVIDAAEAFLSTNQENIDKILKSLTELNIRLVLTLTPEAIKTFHENKTLKKINGVEILIKPLSPQKIIQDFPELIKFLKIAAISKILTIPFYLSAITRLSDRSKIENFLGAHDKRFEGDLIRLVVEGENQKTKKSRLIAWRMLVLKQLENPNIQGVEQQSNTEGFKSLIDSNIIFQKEGKLYFSHELFFEHGLYYILNKKWESNFTKGSSKKFWAKYLSSLLTGYQSMRRFEAWFMLNQESLLQKGLLDDVAVIAETDYFASLIASAIASKNFNLLEECLKKASGKFLSRELSGVLGYYSSTFVLLAIWADYSEGIKILLEFEANLQHFSFLNLSSEISSEKSHSESQESDSGSESSSSHHSDSESSEDDDDDQGWEYEQDEEGNWGYPSSEEAESQPSESSEEDIASTFIRRPYKYWMAGFHEEPGWIDEDSYDQDWVVNPKYQKSPTYDVWYLHQAVQKKHTKCLTALLEFFGEEVNEGNQYQETALHMAASWGVYDCAEALLSHPNINVNARDSWGETPLHNAVYAGHIELIKLLLQNDANLNALSKQNISPFHVALVQHNFEVINLLYENGADCSIKAFEEKTIADLLDTEFSTNDEQNEQIKLFVMKVVEALDFDEENKIVEDLMTLVEGEVQINEHMPYFDFWDEASELEYCLDYVDDEKLFELRDYILNDPENISKVLESGKFDFLEEEILNDWLENSNNEQYLNLKQYAEDEEDEYVLKRLREYEGLDEESLSESSEQENSPRLGQ